MELKEVLHQIDHDKQEAVYEIGRFGKLIFAMALLSDVVDGNFTGENRDFHINEAKRYMVEYMKGIEPIEC